MKTNKVNELIIFFVALLPTVVFAQQHLTYPSFLEKLYNQEILAEVPNSEDRTKTFTSYDRSSRYDSIEHKYVCWGANSDGEGYIRKEGNEIVVFDSDGPGVIWRFWSALAKSGHIKIYIDNKVKPIVDKPFRDFFETFESDIPPMNFPELVTTLSRGRNNFIPITYNKHCKITLTGNWGAYYHIIYSELSQNQIVDSYNGSYSDEDRISLAKTDRILSKRGYERKIYSNENINNIVVKLKPGEDRLVLNLEGSKAISYFQLIPLESTTEYLLKNVWLNFSWDEDYKSAVHTPIGMFFGTGDALNNFRAQPVGVVNNKLYSNWFMPFEKKAELIFENRGDEEVEFKLEVIDVKYGKSSNLLRFHTQFITDEINSEFEAVDNSEVIFDFENLSYNKWGKEGDAFGENPTIQNSYGNQSLVQGYQGKGYINSFQNGEEATGRLLSPVFKISKNYINLLVGGGSNPEKVNVSLLVNNKIVRLATGNDIETLYWNTWDVSDFLGKSAQIVIQDLSSSGWGHINVDQIEQSDTKKSQTDGRNLEWTFLNVKGVGRYCGVTFQIQNEWEKPKEASTSWWYGKWDKKNIDWWWGEGDEKFYVDGEKFPSTFGTGSEDYIGYAWSAEPPFPTFENSFANQPQTPIDGNGVTVVNRYHLADNVPFNTSFYATIERYKNKRWGKNKENKNFYKAAVYYYLLKN